MSRGGNLVYVALVALLFTSLYLALSAMIETEYVLPNETIVVASNVSVPGSAGRGITAGRATIDHYQVDEVEKGGFIRSITRLYSWLTDKGDEPWILRILVLTTIGAVAVITIAAFIRGVI